jgi:hypothetical protein
MAVAVQSSQSTPFASANSVVITKPSGVVVGDLLIAQIVIEGGNGVSVTPPSGWNAITQVNNGGEIGVAVFWKIATSTEVAASNFTFTLSTTVRTAGGMVRIDGHSSGIPIWTSLGASVTNSATPSFANSITPAVANSLIMMFVGASDTNGSATASYAIATSNPSWTEVWDQATVNGSGFSMGAAYGLRSQVTATGNSSCAFAGGDGNTDSACLLLAVPPSKDFTATETITMTDTKLLNLGMLITDILSMTDSVVSRVRRLWTNAVKNIKNWINEDR